MDDLDGGRVLRSSDDSSVMIRCQPRTGKGNVILLGTSTENAHSIHSSCAVLFETLVNGTSIKILVS